MRSNPINVWWAVKLAAPMVNVCCEMLEMRYLWQVPLRLDNPKLRALIGAEPRTALDDALAATLNRSPREILRKSRHENSARF